MGKTTTMTVRLPIDLSAQLDSLAKATDRSRAYLAVTAIAEYVATQKWQVEAIREGLRQADQGHLLEFSDVKRRWEEKHAAEGHAGGSG